jgi:RAT1-interacting protein
MCTPYEKNEDWIICATKWKGTIFLCAKETERKRLSKEQMTDRDKQFASWGYKFEQYMSSGNLLACNRPHENVMYHKWKIPVINGSL